MNTVSAEPLYVKPPTAARIIGVSKATVYRWIAEGHLPARKVGGTVLVSVDALRRLGGTDDRDAT